MLNFKNCYIDFMPFAKIIRAVIVYRLHVNGIIVLQAACEQLISSCYGNKLVFIFANHLVGAVIKPLK